jgi:hypothetical protein
MQSCLICHKINTAIIYFIIAVFITGCNSLTNNEAYDSVIKSSRSFIDAPCIRSSTNTGLIAFFGLRLDGYEPVVTGYYYCNGRSPAKDADILIGDRVVRVRNCLVNSSSDVRQLFQETPTKTFPLLDIYRNGVTEKKGIKVIPFAYGTASSSSYAQSCKTD